MPIQEILNGSFDEDPDAEKIRISFDKAKENFSYLETTKATKEELEASVNGVMQFATLALAIAENPVPSDYTRFDVRNDGDNNGQYIYLASETNGVRFESVFFAKEDYISKQNFNTYSDPLLPSVYSVYNGTGAHIVLPAPIELSSDGDWLEFVCVIENLGTSSDLTGMGIMGERGSNNSNSQIGFFAGGKLYIRDSTGTWITNDGFGEDIIADDTKEIRIKLEYANGDTLIYRDNELVNTINSQGTFIIENVGNAYIDGVTFQGKLRDVKVNALGVQYDLYSVVDHPNVVYQDVTKSLSTSGFLNSKQVDTIKVLSNKKMYYEYLNTSFQGLYGRFYVYQQFPNNLEYYMGIEIIRYNLDAIFSDNWRIGGGRVYRLINGKMVYQNLMVMQQTENELAYQTSGTTHFTGGSHGDEKFIDVHFFASGSELDISGDIPLTSCDAFYYSQKSIMYTTNDNAHPEEAIHDKITTFENIGYRSFNRLTLLIDTNITTWYSGLSSIHKDVGNVIHDEFLDHIHMLGDDQQKFNKTNGAREYYSSNSLNKMGAFATSRVIKPISINNSSLFRVHDRNLSNDNKYYRSNDLGNVFVDDVFESEMVVKFYKF